MNTDCINYTTSCGDCSEGGGVGHVGCYSPPKTKKIRMCEDCISTTGCCEPGIKGVIAGDCFVGKKLPKCGDVQGEIMSKQEEFEAWLEETCLHQPSREALVLAKMAWEAATKKANDFDEAKRNQQAAEGRHKLSCYFGLSYATWLTIPRVLLEAMPNGWQGKLADLLGEYELMFPNQPDIGTRVQITDLDNKLIKTPAWLLNYRHPDHKQLQAMKQRVYKEEVDQ